MEIDGSTCFDLDYSHAFDIEHGMEQCSKNRKCIGLEYDKDMNRFHICLDTIYKSNGLDKYDNMASKIVKKAAGYGE